MIETSPASVVPNSNIGAAWSPAVQKTAHDLNNALTTVIGYAQLMDEDGELPARFRNYVQTILQDAERAQNLTAHLLSLSQPENDVQSTLNAVSSVTPQFSLPLSVRSLRVLVVDDEEPVITLISEILGLDGHEVTPAFNGAEALALLGVEEFDLIISDVRMPAVGGPPFAEILRTQRTDLLPRVIFVTGDTVSASTNHFLHDSGCPVLVKPFAPDRLRALVAQHAT